MDRTAGQKRAVEHLYPAIDPFDRRMLDVGDGHQVYIEQCGNPDGLPILVLHGGPGGGVSPFMRRYFNPEIFRVVLFDQRGCGRSRPHASIEANTTWHLVRDIELIRASLGIAAWHLFGGSWGATLALVYGQEHPSRVLSMVLRGVFLMTRTELDWFYGGGAGAFWPELWEQFQAPIPEAERHDMIAAYNRRLFHGSHSEQVRLARAWAGWENALASIANDGPMGEAPAEYARAFARLENHYFANSGWLDQTTAILNRMDRLDQIPAVIVQGRYDLICPPRAAYDLAALWPRAELRMVTRAGHALTEPGISAELIAATDDIARAALRRG